MSDFIRTSRASIQLPIERREELRERLNEAGLSDAAEDLGARDAFAESRKADVLRVVEAWRQEVAPPDFVPTRRAVSGPAPGVSVEPLRV